MDYVLHHALIIVCVLIKYVCQYVQYAGPFIVVFSSAQGLLKISYVA